MLTAQVARNNHGFCIRRMELQKQVCSLELAKKLKELGVKQESLFYWVKENRLVYKTQTGFYLENGAGFSNDLFNELEIYNATFSAFTVAELGEMLPSAMTLTRKTVENSWRYPSLNGDSLYEKTEADARAKMLIYLIKNNFITIK